MTLKETYSAHYCPVDKVDDSEIAQQEARLTLEDEFLAKLVEYLSKPIETRVVMA